MTDIQILATGSAFVKKGLRGTKPVIDEILKSAKREIHMLAYKFGNDDDLWDLLENKLETGIQLTIIVSMMEQIPEVKKKLYSLSERFGKNNFNLFDFENPEGGLLHAKVIVVDRNKAVVGSANFSLGGMKNHYELGVLITGSHAWKLAEVVEILSEEKRLTKRIR